MPSIGEFFELLYLRYAVKFYNLKEEWQVKKRFYHNKPFKKLNKALLNSPNPYTIPKAFPYGETPLTTLQQIADRWQITCSDYLIELGCGRGRGVFFFSHYTGCTAKGIDWIPSFISHAQTISKAFPHLKTTFSCSDMRRADLSQATVIYLYGTCLDEVDLNGLTQRFKHLPPSTKIITVSSQLPGLVIQDQFTASFPWGEADIYLQATHTSEESVSRL
jgi:SAM-dependent methyltransferase